MELREPSNAPAHETHKARTLAIAGLGLLAVGAAARFGWQHRERLSDLAQAFNRVLLQPLLHKINGNSEMTKPLDVEPDQPTLTLPDVAICIAQKPREYQQNLHDAPFSRLNTTVGIFRDVATSISKKAADSASEDLGVQGFSGVDQIDGEATVRDIMQNARKVAQEARDTGTYPKTASDHAIGAVATQLFQNTKGEDYAAMAATGEGAVILVREDETGVKKALNVKFGSLQDGIATRTLLLQPGDVLINLFNNVLANVSLEKIDALAAVQNPYLLANTLIESAEKSDAKPSDTHGRAQDKTVAIMWYRGKQESN